MPQQLYAEIKPNSKYAHQISWQLKQGEYPFPIQIVSDVCGYVVAGGIGGRYRLIDVDIYVIEGEHRILIN